MDRYPTLQDMLMSLGQAGDMGAAPPMAGAAVPGAAYKTPAQLEAMMGMGAAAPMPPPMPLPPEMAAPTEQPITSYPPLTTPPAQGALPVPGMMPGGMGADEFFANYAAKWQPENEVNPMTSLMDRLGSKVTAPAPAPQQVRTTPQFGGMGGSSPSRPSQMVMPAPSQGERSLRASGFGRPVERMNWLRGLQSQRGY